MLEMFYPYEYVDSVFSIDFQALWEKGYRGLIFDIDNTLVHHGDDATAEVDGLFLRLHSIGFKALLLSNNTAERVARFTQNIDCPYIADANKPNPASYRKAVEMLRIRNDEAIVIGDQIFTDIYGANRSGIPSILVHYIQLPGETKIGVRRHIEKIILQFYNWNGACKGRIGNIAKESG